MNRSVTTPLVLLFAAGFFVSTANAHVRASDLTVRANTTELVLQSNKTPVKSTATQSVSLSAQDLAKMLEQQMLAGQAVSMKFTINGGESVNVIADVNSKRVRIESGSMTIVSDGQTVWNHQKKSNQVTIDAIGTGRESALQNPKDLFLFATNYTPKVTIAKNNLYVLTLTPNQKVQNILQAAGGISKITFTLGVVKDKITIKAATAESKGENVEAGGLTVKSLKKVSASQFTFSQPKGARVIDLRE